MKLRLNRQRDVQPCAVNPQLEATFERLSYETCATLEHRKTFLMWYSGLGGNMPGVYGVSDGATRLIIKQLQSTK